MNGDRIAGAMAAILDEELEAEARRLEAEAANAEAVGQENNRT